MERILIRYRVRPDRSYRAALEERCEQRDVAEFTVQGSYGMGE
ncbi:hypothetical protein [Micromonospora endophytica]|nr:hypothetical protein [Micromonospora endophytica]